MKSACRTIYRVLLCGLVLALENVSQAFVFNFENDFSKTTNTNTSIWSYRWKDGFTRDGNYALLPVFHSGADWPYVPSWHRGASPVYPFIGVSDSTGQSVIHPLGAPDGSGLAVVSWLSPFTGTVNIAIRVTALSGWGNGVEYYVDKGSGAGNLAAGIIPGGGSTCLIWITNVTVSVGDRLNFIIGPNGNYWDDSTRMFVEITDEAIPVSSPTPPALPTATLLLTNMTHVELNWIDECNNSGNVNGYKIERALEVDGLPGTWGEIAAITIAYSHDNAYTDTGVAANVTYFYRVRAFNSIGDSDDSGNMMITVWACAAPTDFMDAYDACATQVQVVVHWWDWNNNVDNVDGYKIERAPNENDNPGTWSEIGAITNGYSLETFYADTNVVADATYWYRVRAFNRFGDSPYIYPAVVTLGPPWPPFEDTYPRSACANQVQIDLYWYDWNNYPGNVLGYKVERAPDEDDDPGTWAEFAVVPHNGTSDNLLSDTNVVANATYWYRVRAYNILGDSDYNNPAAVTVGPLAAPYLDVLSLADTNLVEIEIYWHDVDNYSGNILGYRIERATDAGGTPASWEEIAIVPNTGISDYLLNDAGVVAGMTYWYRVRAYNVLGNSDFSNEASIRIPSVFEQWQSNYFSCTNCPMADPTADPDGDGQNNLAEFLSGTEPTNSASAFRITSVLAEGTGIRITWSAVGGKTNWVQGGIGDVDNNSPSYTNQYLDMSDQIIIPGSGDVVTNFFDDGAWWGDFSNWPAHYYRIRLTP